MNFFLSSTYVVKGSVVNPDDWLNVCESRKGVTRSFVKSVLTDLRKIGADELDDDDRQTRQQPSTDYEQERLRETDKAHTENDS